MMIRIVGAVMIFVGCAAVGFMMASAYRRELRILSEYIELLNGIECELQYKFDQLPTLLRNVAGEKNGKVFAFCRTLSKELETQVQPSVLHCLTASLKKHPELPDSTTVLLQKLGQTLGQYDMDGQLLEIRSLRKQAELQITSLRENQDTKIKSYKALSICAGAAVVIIFI